MARNLGCFSTSRVSQARVVATAVFIKLPMAYVFAYTIRALSRWLAKHILRAAEFLRDLVAREVIALKHLPGKIMLADVLTKAVARAIFLLLTRLIAEYSTTGIASPT